MAGPDAADPLSRAFPRRRAAGRAARPARRGARRRRSSAHLTPRCARRPSPRRPTRLAAAGAVAAARRARPPFLEAARLLYDGALVAERHAAVGAFVDAHPGGGRPDRRRRSSRAAGDDRRHATTSPTPSASRRCGPRPWPRSAAPTRCCCRRRPRSRRSPRSLADPVGVNSRLGIYTNFCNLFDLCAVAVPAGPSRRRRVRRHGAGPRLRRSVSARRHRRAGHRKPRCRAPAARSDRPAIELLVIGAHRTRPAAQRPAHRAGRTLRRRPSARLPRTSMYALGHRAAEARARPRRRRRRRGDRGRAVAAARRRARDASWPRCPAR